MVIQIEIDSRDVPFEMDLHSSRWHSDEKQEEAVFPLVATADGRRYELYSDGTFAEVEL